MKLIKIAPIFVLCGLLQSCWTTEEGEKHGVLVKVSKSGLWWGTYEGELIRGGLSNANGANGAKFDFTFGQFKSKLVDSAMDVLNNNKSIVLHYHCEAFVAPWRGENRCFADSINIIKDSQ